MGQKILQELNESCIASTIVLPKAPPQVVVCVKIGLGKGPRVRTRILDAQSAMLLYVGVLPTKLLAQTKNIF